MERLAPIGSALATEPGVSTRDAGNWYAAGAGTEVEYCLVRGAVVREN